jgi:hypothetical protein
MSLAIGNLCHVAVLQGRYTEAVPLGRECLLLCVRRGDRRGGAEALLSLAAAVAGLGEDELSVELDAIHRAVADDAGIIDVPLLVEQLEPLLALARTRLGPERAAELEAEVGEPTLELAVELLTATIDA